MGRLETVKSSDLRTLHSDFDKTGEYSIPCSLEGVCINRKWTQEDSENLRIHLTNYETIHVTKTVSIRNLFEYELHEGLSKSLGMVSELFYGVIIFHIEFVNPFCSTFGIQNR